MPVPIAPRIPLAPGSARNRETARPTGSANNDGDGAGEDGSVDVRKRPEVERDGIPGRSHQECEPVPADGRRPLLEKGEHYHDQGGGRRAAHKCGEGAVSVG